jgi:hypothetical protein
MVVRDAASASPTPPGRRWTGREVLISSGVAGAGATLPSACGPAAAPPARLFPRPDYGLGAEVVPTLWLA